MRSLLFFLILLQALASCSLFRKGEKALPDLPPPPYYRPLHIQTFQNINQVKPRTLNLEISRYTMLTDEVARVYFHLIGDDTIYYSFASTGEFKKKWCGAYFIADNEIIPVVKFEIKESQASYRLPYAIVLVLDHSGSMGDERAYEIQEAAYNFILNKHPDDFVGVVKYDHRIVVEIPLTQSSEYAANHLIVDGLGFLGGWTAISDAIIQGINELNKVDAKFQKVLIVLTDGWDNSSDYTPQEAVEYAKLNGVSICGIDFGYDINPGFMEYFARKTGGIYKHIYSKYEFNLIFNDILNRYQRFYYADVELPIYGPQYFVVKFCNDTQVLEDTILIEQNVDTGKVYTLKVYFDFDKHTLKPESFIAIKSVAKLMKKNPTMEIELTGHTDSINRTGNPNYNLELSQRRANEVKRALIKEGVEEYRIKANGYGDTKPIADNSTEEGRARNRRVEFRVLRWKR
ncbi:MAG: OmpA family protein [Candidatus Kapaibacteriota bacterium]